MLIYDGDCGFCTRSALWIEARLPDEQDVVPFQSIDIDEYGLTLDDVTTAAWWIDADGATHGGHAAIGYGLIEIGGIWAVAGWLIVTPPISWIAKPIYGLIARNRSKMPGATDACEVPR